MNFKKRSPYTEALIARLTACKEGDEVSYDELSDIVGRDVRGEGRWILDSAKRIAEREDKLHFEHVRGRGIRRIVNGEQIPLAEAGVRAMGRKSQRIGRMIDTARPDDLTAHEKKQFYAVSTWNKTLAFFASSRTFRGFTKRIGLNRVRSEADTQAALVSTVEAFASGRARQPRKA